ncbi:hypothetical protein [Neorhizobium galegae]|uniref:Uncharacterized protein n=1 Tax=Neorhizobium galegae bv. orientalis str. HAMBI 540 TaxID=1028800 RepID=A0A068T0L2_NEOGA|nr:hypothetical protein [Neorhizobium galegae]MCQ1853381.1 hypothetical protein [Neorhizobium galegae]CDN51982.1 Hypothetical protein RG540_PA13060 [Neorhizobium galegae bv. orientalis str. HAMBI 540]CDZ53085.1 Hypothetical protein NGAL_HAMBI2427_49770 [Neorhizobium galegae bv. orientalis]
MDWIDVKPLGLLLAAIALLNFPLALFQFWRATFRFDRMITALKVLAALIFIWILLTLIHRLLDESAYEGWLLTAAIFNNLALAVAVPSWAGAPLGQALAWFVWRLT